MHFTILFFPFCADLMIALKACNKATINEPKQTEPNEVVMVLLNAGGVGLKFISVEKYHVAVTPHVVQ